MKQLVQIVMVKDKSLPINVQNVMVMDIREQKRKLKLIFLLVFLQDNKSVFKARVNVVSMGDQMVTSS